MNLAESRKWCERNGRRFEIVSEGPITRCTIYGPDGVTPGLISVSETVDEDRISRYVEMLKMGAECVLFAAVTGSVLFFTGAI